MSALFEAESVEAGHTDPVELRVLVGDQAGARVVLAPGEYLLGSGDDCGLVLRGAGIAEQHALLRFDGKDADIEPLDGAICNVQGDEIAGTHAIAHGVPLEIGGVWIAVDREDAPWPDTASDFRRPSVADAAGEAADAWSSDAAEPQPLTEDDSELSNGRDSEASDAASPTRRVLAIFAGIFLIFLLAAAAWAWWSGRSVPMQTTGNTEPAAQQPRLAPEELRRIVADYRQDGRLELKWSGKQWVVSGYVSDAQARRMLLDGLANAGEENVRAQVWVDTELMEAARRALAANAVPGETSLRVDAVSAGVATLGGAVASEDRLEGARNALIHDVPGIVSVESKALLPSALLQQLKERVAAAGLASRLAVISDAPEVKLSGRLFPDEVAKWESLFVEFTRDYGDVLPIRATITRVIPKPPVGVQTIVGGSVPYIVTDSGQFVNQGGDVQGHTLTAIRDGEVVFEGSKRVRLAR